MGIMENFIFAVGVDGVATATFDMPGRTVNVISGSVQRDLDILVERIKADDAIKGVVLRSGKANGFCAGADLNALRLDMARWSDADTQDKLRQGVEEAGAFSQRIRAIETCGKPVAVVMTGATVGGGLELALGCHFRIAVDTPALQLALPEAGLGLMPGGGGTQRLIRLAGLAAAMPYLLDGAPIALADALAMGLVHKVSTPDQAEALARVWILETGDAQPLWDSNAFRMPCGGPHSPAGYREFGPAMAGRLATGDGPATANILKAMYEGAQVPIDAGLRIESRYFFNTARSKPARAGVERFFARRKQGASADSSLA